MEIRIGIKHSPRELIFDTDTAVEDLLALVDDAAAKEKDFLTLSDAKGRQYMVSLPSIAYIEFGGDAGRKVGFVS